MDLNSQITLSYRDNSQFIRSILGRARNQAVGGHAGPGVNLRIVTYNNHHFMYKIVTDRYGEITEATATQLCDAVIAYRNGIMRLGINVSEFFIIGFSTPESHRGTQIEMLETFYPVQMESFLLSQPVDQVINAARQLLHGLSKLLQQEPFTYGIDSKPENFALSGSEPVLLDYLPPLIQNIKYHWMLRRKDEGLQEINWKISRYFSPANILLTSFTRLCKARLDLITPLRNLYIDVVQALPSARFQALVNSTFFQVLTNPYWEGSRSDTWCQYLVDLVLTSTMENRDVLRMLYLMIVYKKMETQTFTSTDMALREYQAFISASKLPGNLDECKRRLLISLLDK